MRKIDEIEKLINLFELSLDVYTAPKTFDKLTWLTNRVRQLEAALRRIDDYGDTDCIAHKALEEE